MPGLWLDYLTDITKRSPCCRGRQCSPCTAQGTRVYMQGCCVHEELKSLSLGLHGESQFAFSFLLIENTLSTMDLL